MAGDVEAPIVAVTVYPSSARVSRRGQTSVEAGTTEVSVPDLPQGIDPDSVRVRGRGEGCRIVGVDVRTVHHLDAPDDAVRAAEAEVRMAERRVRSLDDDDAAAAVQTAFVDSLAQQSGSRVARALADGSADAGRVADVATTIGNQLRTVQARRAEIADARVDASRALDAANARLAALGAQRATHRPVVVVAVEADAPATIELEVDYLTYGAGWHPTYDARVDGTAVSLTWHGVVVQTTGEDWPPVELALSTARPAASTTIPELGPWYLSERPPPMPKMAVRAGAGRADMDVLQAAESAGMAPAAASPMPVLEAEAEQSLVATTYRLPRPTGVPSDGAPHEATITTFDFEAELDHLTVPKVAPEAYVRATVVNASNQTLLPGPVAVFHGAEFVGSTAIETVAPGDEVELQLGIDDRVTVERQLADREASKALLGSTRKVTLRWRTTVVNRRSDPVRVTVVDQLPVSRHADIKVRDEHLSPEPSERDDLGELRWKLDLPPGAEGVIELGFTAEHPKNLSVWGLD